MSKIFSLAFLFFSSGFFEMLENRNYTGIRIDIIELMILSIYTLLSISNELGKKKYKIVLILYLYLLVRIIYVTMFSYIYKYSIIAYLLPLKGLIGLIMAFELGMSWKEGLSAKIDLLAKIFESTILIVFIYQVTSMLFKSRFDQYNISRLKFLNYRIGIYSIMYSIYLLKVINDKIRIKNLLIIFVALISSQNKNMVLATFIILILNIKNKKMKILFSLFSIVILLLAIMNTNILQNLLSDNDQYFSTWRRVKEIEYVIDKFKLNVLFGYPIPSLKYNNIPEDIIKYFVGFKFEETLFPSDIPLLFLLSEEGLLGILMLILILTYTKMANRKDGKFLIIIALSNIITFPMYYLYFSQSSLFYFLLGSAFCKLEYHESKKCIKLLNNSDNKIKYLELDRFEKLQ